MEPRRIQRWLSTFDVLKPWNPHKTRRIKGSSWNFIIFVNWKPPKLRVERQWLATVPKRQRRTCWFGRATSFEIYSNSMQRLPSWAYSFPFCASCSACFLVWHSHAIRSWAKLWTRLRAKPSEALAKNAASYNLYPIFPLQGCKFTCFWHFTPFWLPPATPVHCSGSLRTLMSAPQPTSTDVGDCLRGVGSVLADVFVHGPLHHTESY